MAVKWLYDAYARMKGREENMWEDGCGRMKLREWKASPGYVEWQATFDCASRLWEYLNRVDEYENS